MVDILNCKIVENTDIRMGAIRVDAGAEALFDNCVVADNATKSTAAYNGGCLWADGAKLLRINNCTFNNNKTSGVGICMYIFGDTGGKTNVLISNTTISNNSVNPEHATKNGGGIYVRENGNLVIVNSTVYGNHSGKGGGIAVYGTAAMPSKAVIVSCTIAGNTTVTVGNGAGLQQAAVGGAIEVYNTLISGNTTDGAADDVAWFETRRGLHRSIIRAQFTMPTLIIAGAAFDLCLDAQPAGRQRRCDEDLRAARRRESGAPVPAYRRAKKIPGRDRSIKPSTKTRSAPSTRPGALHEQRQ